MNTSKKSINVLKNIKDKINNKESTTINRKNQNKSKEYKETCDKRVVK